MKLPFRETRGQPPRPLLAPSILRYSLKKDSILRPRRADNLHSAVRSDKGGAVMTNLRTRRQILKGTLALAGWSAFGIPEWALPALAQGETVVPFTDLPANTNFTPAADRRTLDIRKIDGPFTPKDLFFTTQHYGHPDVDLATYRLKVTGLVERPKSLSLDELKKMANSELIAGFECSGNRRPLQGLSGNGRWTGAPLKTVLDSAGVKNSAREFVFFGAD